MIVMRTMITARTEYCNYTTETWYQIFTMLQFSAVHSPSKFSYFYTKSCLI